MMLRACDGPEHQLSTVYAIFMSLFAISRFSFFSSIYSSYLAVADVCCRARSPPSFARDLCVPGAIAAMIGASVRRYC